MPDGFAPRLALAALRALPRNLISRGAGRIASTRLPRSLRARACRVFGRAVGVDFGEVRDPLDSFESLQAFFTRALRPGLRPLDPSPDALLSPCDGAFGASGVVRDGTLLQVKGRPYRLAALLGSADEARSFEGGSYATLYLSPRDYHRFHAPCDARVTRLRAIPGTLWPVNRLGVEHVDGLFAENERICAFFEIAPPFGGRLAIAAVGATMVGKVRVSFDPLTTNLAGARRAERDFGREGPRIARGEEWGRFEFGSTLVLVLAREAGRLEPLAEGTPVRLGRRIGAIGPGAFLAEGRPEATVNA